MSAIRNITRSPVTADTHRAKKIKHLSGVEKRMQRSCQQIVLLSDKILALETRYKRAKADFNNNFRYSIRVRPAVLEGIRNVFYEYALDRAEEIKELRMELFNQTVDIIEGDGEHYSDEPDYSDESDYSGDSDCSDEEAESNYSGESDYRDEENNEEEDMDCY